MSSLLVGAYRPAETLLHGLPAGAKLLALLVAGPLVAVVRGWQSALLALGVAVVLLALARTPGRDLVRALRWLLLLVLVLGGWLTRQEGWPRAVETVGDLVALVLLATVVTTTTPVDAMLDVVERALEPPSRLLRRLPGHRLRIDPERVALAFSLVLRTIPATIGLAEETRDAARARGLERDVRARLTPFAIRVVADAQATGEALHARGVGDD
ncbi:energy-coupling factor transporter transmembrane protein EcfT [Janibacter cremeus]|uniref:CbiQ family ECF transporter T component n=1 Tax=Janibacter cremeus TaxID=1285192 RepID=UPI0023F8AC8C|nr:CbiQ family ECF transporter T component [Janibacter cremeus]WEV76810.1 energy-coupling factor transporter transmembrane protein EcfT [Janibacter cremeus]